MSPRPWICYVQGDASSAAQWQTPNGSVVPTVPSGFTQATGSELYQYALLDGRLVLIRGPEYNSPDGEYCCLLLAVPSQRRCVTLSKCVVVL